MEWMRINKKRSLLLDYNDGGLKMISIRAKLKTISLNSVLIGPSTSLAFTG